MLSLPALQSRRLRELTLDASAHPRAQPYLSAASGLVCAHGQAYVVADDEHHLAVFRDRDAPGSLHRIRSGDLPAKSKARKRRKPDLETLLLLPPPSGAGGALLALDLGMLDGVPLGFTDGAARADGSWVFCAAAEHSADSVADGACRGSVVGQVSARGDQVAIHPLAGCAKVEGIALQPDGPSICMVTDADDPGQCAQLLHTRLPNPRA